VTSKDPEDKDVFALMTMDEVDFEVMPNTTPCSSKPPDEPITNSYNKIAGQGHEMSRGWVVSKIPNTTPIVFNTGQEINNKTLTLIDSGASDHCFTNKELFIQINPLQRPTTGITASKQSTFHVEGRGKVKLRTNINGVSKTITFDDALYTPELRSNLISVSKLAEKGIKVEFDVVQLTLVTGIKPTVPLSAIDKENSLESSLHWSIYLYTIHLVCALIIPHSQPNYV